MASKDVKPGLMDLEVPVQLQSSTASRVYTHIHPILVLSLFYSRLSATVADPVTSLLQLLGPVAFLQVLYSILCVPISSTPTSKSSKPSSTQPQQHRKPKAAGRGTSLLSRVFVSAPEPRRQRRANAAQPAILSLTLSATLAAPLLFLLIVLHGGSITSHLPHTALTALHMALLATLPLFFAHGVDAAKWRHLAGLMAPVDELFGAALGACVGAWVGAVPIPLDWDREWQRWPVTVVYGVVAGWAVGKLIGGTLAFGWKIQLDK